MTRGLDELEAGLAHVRDAPTDHGRLGLIVRRPGLGEREVVDVAVLDLRDGLVGDNWRTRGSRLTPDGSADPAKQLTMMNARAAALVAGAEAGARWALAGDQLYLDFDLSEANVGPGTTLAIGAAVIEVTDRPHLGCAKFAARFGTDALRFVNSPVGRSLRLRGINARVLRPGTIRAGDTVRKVAVRAEAGAAP
ncbi:MAG: MOSC domain-containing protein [Actinomycetota bacterium]|nr:MOSC domain-containing protein [Actinomycetota bacterium]